MIRRKPRTDPVTEAEAIAIFLRDGGCLAPRLGGSAMDCWGRNRIEHVKHRSGRAAVQRTFQRADAGDDGAHHVGAGRCDDARGERRGVQAVIGDAAEIRIKALNQWSGRRGAA